MTKPLSEYLMSNSPTKANPTLPLTSYLSPLLQNGTGAYINLNTQQSVPLGTPSQEYTASGQPIGQAPQVAGGQSFAAQKPLSEFLQPLISAIKPPETQVVATTANTPQVFDASKQAAEQFRALSPAEKWKEISRYLMGIGQMIAKAGVKFGYSALPETKRMIETGEPSEGINVGKIGKILLGTDKITSYQRDIINNLAKLQGQKPQEPYYKLVAEASAMPVLEMLTDAWITSGLLTAGAKQLEKLLPDKETINNWAVAGYPQTREEGIKNLYEQAHMYHPDKAAAYGISPEVAKQESARISKALTAFRNPKINPIPNQNIVQNVLGRFGQVLLEQPSQVNQLLTQPLIQKGEPIIRGLLPSESGMTPVQPYQPTTPAVPVGLSTKEIPVSPEKPISKAKERGYITSVKKILPELKISGQYISRDTDELALNAMKLIKYDIASAEKLAMSETNDKAVATASELLKYYGREASKATDETIKNAFYDKAVKIANTIAHKLTEEGRTIQAASILGRLTPEGQVRFAATEIQRYNASLKKGQKAIPELTAEQAQTILTEMNVIANMPDGDAKAMRFQALQNYIQDLIPSPLIDKVIAIWKAGLLTGIKTSGLNIFANLSHAITETVKDIPAVAVDKVISLFTGKRTIGFTTRGLSGVIEGFNKGVRYLKTGFDERNVGIKLDWKRVNFGTSKIAKGLQKYEETIFRILGAEDQPFYYGAKARSLVDQAIAQAINKGLKGAEKKAFIEHLIQNPTDEMLKYAVKDAEIAVFQNPTQLGNIAKLIQKTKIGEFIVPFGRTPSAVATQIINYSPVGIVKTIVEHIGKGRFDQRDFAKSIGRAIVGIAALYIGAKLYQQGRIALNRPKSEREQKLWELEGRKANSVYVGGTCIKGQCSGGKWRSISALGPNGNLLLVGGYFQKAYNETGSPTAAIMRALTGGAASFTEQTFLQGMNQVITALNDPERSAEGYFGSALSSFVPTISGDIAKALDPKERRTETIWERIQAKIPFIRRRLEPRINVLGEQQARIGNPLEVMLDPTRPSPDISTPLVRELRRLFDLGYTVSPTLLGDKKGYKCLTRQQNTELWEKAGEITNAKLNGLINTQIYRDFPDDKKAEMIDAFVKKAKLTARVGMVIQLTQGLHGSELINKLKELKDGGLLTREVFNLYMKLR